MSGKGIVLGLPRPHPSSRVQLGRGLFTTLHLPRASSALVLVESGASRSIYSTISSARTQDRVEIGAVSHPLQSYKYILMHAEPSI